MAPARSPRALSPALKRLRRAIGLAIRARRQTSGFTQVGLAKRARLHPISLAQIERGGHTPSLEILCRIARALDLTPEALLREAVTPDPPVPAAVRRSTS
jgi:transcriptional regulator with XRE-family HTH domain